MWFIQIVVILVSVVLLGSGDTSCEDDRLCPASFQIQSDIGLGDECEVSETSGILASISKDVTDVINNEVREELGLRLRAKYLGRSREFPANSCREILDLASVSESGEYWLQNPSGVVFEAYCNMELTCGPFNNITGWMRVANVNLTDLNQDCPPGNFHLAPGPSRYCIRNDNNFGCDSSIFRVGQVPYTQVCGRATGVQIGSVDGFLDPNPMRPIDEVYTDGISLTYSSNPRQHIWTFAASLSEIFLNCPCSMDGTVHSNRSSPQFVDDYYFCESAATTDTIGNFPFLDDNLWDGEMCRSFEVPCCTGNFRPPWFYRDLESRQTSDIEMRLCIDEGTDEDVGLKALELYVQ